MITKTIYTPEFLAKIRQKLEEEKGRLERELSKFAKKAPGADIDYNAQYPEFGDKEDENAAEVAQYSTDLSLEQTLERMLRDVNTSLERLAKGTYGICKYCDKLIEEKRLLARPTSGSCIDCKKTLTQEL